VLNFPILPAVAFVCSIYYYIFSTMESDSNSDSIESAVRCILMSGGDRSLSDYDDSSSDSESSVYISQAEQWNEVDRYQAHPAPLSFPFKGTAATHFEGEQDDDLLQFLSLFPHNTLMDIIVD
jgi:hypothetical protein